MIISQPPGRSVRVEPDNRCVIGHSVRLPYYGAGGAGFVPVVVAERFGERIDIAYLFS